MVAELSGEIGEGSTVEGILDGRQARRFVLAKERLRAAVISGQDAIISGTAKFGIGASGLVFVSRIMEHGLPGLPSGSEAATAILAGTLATVLAEGALFSKLGRGDENKD